MNFIMFLLCLAKCFDPSQSIFRKYMNTLQNFLYHVIQTENTDASMLRPYSFIVLKENQKNFVIKHVKQNVLYKIYYSDSKNQVYNQGEDLVKNIESKFLCKIYDIKNVMIKMNNLFNQEVYFKIVATELLGKTLEHNYFDTPYYNIHEDEKIKELKCIIRSVLEAVIKLNESNKVHLDIKTENVMRYVKNGETGYKLIDFAGVQELSSGQYGDLYYTPGYQPPEFDEKYESININYDIWSIGMLAFYLYTGRYFQDNDNKMHPSSYEYFINQRFKIIDNVIRNSNFKKFIIECLSESNCRPKARDLINHEFLIDT